jgi:hypothetical protein
MSALGQKQTSRRLHLISALPPIADIDQRGGDVRFVPKADIVTLFDPLVRGRFPRTINDDGMVRPSVLAVRILMKQFKLWVLASFRHRWSLLILVLAPFGTNAALRHLT